MKFSKKKANGLFSPVPFLGLAMFGLMWLCSYGEPSQVTLRFSEIIAICPTTRNAFETKTHSGLIQ